MGRKRQEGEEGWVILLERDQSFLSIKINLSIRDNGGGGGKLIFHWSDISKEELVGSLVCEVVDSEIKKEE